jgi:hypothetical protein
VAVGADGVPELMFAAVLHSSLVSGVSLPDLMLVSLIITLRDVDLGMN